MVNILYPRTISIRRPKTIGATTVGAVGYGGADPANETVLYTNIPAGISYERIGRGDPADLPTDSRRANCLVVLPANVVPNGAITENDIIVDDLGKRYQVFHADQQILGYNLHVELLIV